jgi:hypothetical protein
VLLRIGVTSLGRGRRAFDSVGNTLNCPRRTVSDNISGIFNSMEQMLSTILQILLRLLVHDTFLSVEIQDADCAA